MSESTQHKLDRVRPPRVQITYDVEIGDAIQMKELPMTVGIMSDLSGQQDNPAKLKDRKFVEIDRDNFNDVLASLNPRLKFLVDNRLKGDGSKLKVELSFKNMDDFNPAKLVKQVEPLRRLLETRQKLVDLLAKLDGNDELNALLQDVLDSTQDLQAIKNAVEKKGR